MHYSKAEWAVFVKFRPSGLCHVEAIIFVLLFLTKLWRFMVNYDELRKDFITSLEV